MKLILALLMVTSVFAETYLCSGFCFGDHFELENTQVARTVLFKVSGDEELTEEEVCGKYKNLSFSLSLVDPKSPFQKRDKTIDINFAKNEKSCTEI